VCACVCMCAHAHVYERGEGWVYARNAVYAVKKGRLHSGSAKEEITISVHLFALTPYIICAVIKLPNFDQLVNEACS
jgi:hypothetical protein